MSRKYELQQRLFRDGFLQHEDLAAHLDCQSQQLRQVEMATSEGDLSEIAKNVTGLDFDLVRYACLFLAGRAEAAAIHDCSELLAESVLDASGEGESSRWKHWERWLDAAPCWPQLAQGKWHYVVSQALPTVVERLRKAGVTVNDGAVDDIERALGEIGLADLLPPELFERFFPVGAGDGGGGGG